MTSCRDRLIEMPELVKNICRLLYYKHLTRLCCVAVKCVSALATDPVLQVHFLQVNTPHTPSLDSVKHKHVTNVSHVTFFFIIFFFDKLVKLIGGGSVINGAYPV